ncbi:SRPBCC family protein [Ferrovibrio sp.]|uniref:SRPBCC family protein n=1 Tax=Ferrovibrio sp. TaxID=1917215 RepID=UPI003D0C4505
MSSIEPIDYRAAQGHDIVLVRDFDAPPALVYRAWTDAAHLARWWGPHGYTNPVCRIDARPGGEIYIVMTGPDGVGLPIKGRVLEAIPGESLIYSMDADNSRGEWEIETMPRHAIHMIRLAPLDGGKRTRQTVTARMGNADDLAFMARMGMAEGFGQSLERLADLVTA